MKSLLELAKAGSPNSAGWIECDCPYCKKEGHLRLNLNGSDEESVKGGFICYSCGNKGSVKKLALAYKIKFNEAIFSDTISMSLSDIEHDEYEIKLPKGYKEKVHYEYVLNRVKDKDIVEMADFGGVYSGFYYGYCIFPIKNETGLCGYVGRDTTNNLKIRYLNSKNSSLSKALFKPNVPKKPKNAIMVEGIFDSLSVERAIKNESDFTSYSSFGKKLSESQSIQMVDDGIENLYIMFDEKAKKEAVKFGKENLSLFNNVYISNIWGNKDPGEMNDMEILKTIENSKDIYDYIYGNIKF